MPHQRLKPEFTFDKERLTELQKLIPEAFADGKINWNTLKEGLGEYLEEEGPDSENFGLFWPGKKQARRIASIPSNGTLVPVYGEGLKADGTPDTDGINDSKNIFIEGENLEVLKILQKSYAGRIKMIYIDPPYNTGNDFVYEDDFKEPLQEYLRRTGQLDEEGKPLTTNTRADGRFHSKWLSMMYPRLRLARNLMRDDGVIFISINDNELHHIRSVVGEIFGEENFIADLIWANKEGGGSSDTKFFRVKHEHILCFSKDIQLLCIAGTDITNPERYKEKDEFYDVRGPYYLQKLGMGTIQYSASLDYPVIAPDGSKIFPKDNNGGRKACWRWSEKKLKWGIENGFIVIKRDIKQVWTVYTKQYLKCDNEGKIIERTQRPFGVIESFSSTQASKNLENLGLGAYFSYSKPFELISFLIERVCNDDDIILDFFAGSATTGHSVFEINTRKNINMHFILVQLPERYDEKSEAYKAGYKFISEISKERLRRVVKSIVRQNKNEKKNATVYDLGFSSYKLSKSSFRNWENYEGIQLSDLEFKFSDFQLPLIHNWSPKELLIEIILLEGFPLNSSIAYKNITVNKLTSVNSDFNEHELLICLDNKISIETIKSLHLSNDTIFICLDDSISDQEKVQLADKGMIKTI